MLMLLLFLLFLHAHRRTARTTQWNGVVWFTSCLKLPHTLLIKQRYMKLRPPFLFQMIILSMHLYTSNEYHAWFHLYGTKRPARSASKAKKCKMENSCPRWDSIPQPWDLKSDALRIEVIGLRCKQYYLNDLFVYMYFIPIYTLRIRYRFENEEVERILSCKCSVLCFVI